MMGKTKPPATPRNEHGVAGAQLRSYIERIERLEEEKAELGGVIREVFAEARGTGFDPKTMREVIRLRKLDSADRAEQQTLLEIYLDALGMRWEATPLGEAGDDKMAAE